MPVDFEAGGAWWERLAAVGFEGGKRAVVVSAGVTMYVTKEAMRATLRQIAGLASGSTFAMMFRLRDEFLGAADRSARQATVIGARPAGTPFISFYTPEEMLALACDAGFADAEHVPGAPLAVRYFADRADRLRPPSGEDFLVATT